MELLYARNYTSSSTKKTCYPPLRSPVPALILFAAGGIGVSVLDVRRPLKSTEDAVTKVLARVTFASRTPLLIVARCRKRTV